MLAIPMLFACAPSDQDGETASRPNLVLFVLDAARADHFGVYGYERDTTPHIDAFSKRSIRYSRVLAEGSFTFASVSSLFTGMPPSRTGIVHAQRLREDLVVFAEVARRAGYRTHGYSGNPYVTGHFGFDRGFESFDAPLSYEKYKAAPKNFAHRDVAPGIDAVLDFIAADSPSPFLAYVHVLRPHNPYTPPAPFAGRFGSRTASADGSTDALFAIDRRRRASAERLANIVALYDESLAYADAMFGRLLAGLDALERLEDTIVIVVSDHGEGFLEHGRMLHGSTPFEEMIHVPLIVHVPGTEPGVVDAAVQLADLGRGLRVLFEGSSPAVFLEGLGRSPGELTFSWAMRANHRAAVRSETRLLIVNTLTREAVSYYDLERDPGEREPIPLDGEGRRLLAVAQRRIEDGPVSLTRRTRKQREELHPQLRALGYVE